MTQVLINNQKFNLKEDYTIAEYISIKNFDPTLDLNWARIFSDGFNIPYDLADQIPLKNLELGVALIQAYLLHLQEPLHKEVGLGRLMNLDQITLGEFIDLEVALEKGLNKNILSILSILYRDEIKDSYFIKDYIKGLEYYLRWRENIYKSYQYLFNLDIEDDEPNKKSDTDIRHSWYDIIMILADGKFLNINAVTEKPLISAFNWLAWNKDRLEKEELELMKIKQQQKASR